MGTFQLPTYTTIDEPLNALATVAGSSGSLGQNVYTHDSQV